VNHISIRSESEQGYGYEGPNFQRPALGRTLGSEGAGDQGGGVERSRPSETFCREWLAEHGGLGWLGDAIDIS
jgi:hypothetical protein